MRILLDIDGVLVTTPAWKKPELLSDGFLKFNVDASKNLARIIETTSATIILTTTHRINFTEDQWVQIFVTRGINVKTVSKINAKQTLQSMPDRATEIREWVEQFGSDQKFVVIDDDASLNGLPKSIKDKCIITSSMTGLDNQSTEKVIELLA